MTRSIVQRITLQVLMDRVIHIKRSRMEDYGIVFNILEKSSSVFDILHFDKSLYLTEISLPHLFFRSKNHNDFDGPKTIHNLKEVVLPHHSHTMGTFDAIFGTFLKCSTDEGGVFRHLFSFAYVCSRYILLPSKSNPLPGLGIHKKGHRSM